MQLFKAFRKANNTFTLLQKIYLGFGAILLVFSFVTFTYVRQSKDVEENIESVNITMEILRLAEGLEKDAIDSETGVRGFLVTEDSTFLEPYYRGRREYTTKLHELNSLIIDKDQLKQLGQIDSIYSHWKKSFAEPSIQLQKAALASPENVPAYQEFLNNSIKQGKGKKIMDSLRSRIAVFDDIEREIKDDRIANLNASIRFSNALAISLTVACIITGIIVAFAVGSIMKKRLREIATMAGEIAQGNFNVKIKSASDDEISKVTDSLNLMAEQLNTSFNNLKKLNKELDQFAYVVSHDLKAPLRAINSLAEWIEDDLHYVDPDVKRNLELMRGRVFRMENLINGILTYSRIGRKELPVSTFAVSALLEEVVDLLGLEAEQSVSFEKDLPVITTERLLLHQVFSNLISNGIKYNNKQNPVVRVGYKDVKNYFEFYVDDNGQGIPSEYHEKIFGVFQTMEARDTKESTGIGLAIVKKIVLEKSGTIYVTSKEGKGSRFTFTWPKQHKLQPVTELVHVLN